MNQGVMASSGTGLKAAWDRSDRIFSLLAPDAICSRPIPLRQPFLFYVGHLPGFAWNQLARGAAGRASFNARFDELFERGIDPPDDAEPGVDDPLAWPSLEQVLEYRDRVRVELPHLLEHPVVQEVLPMVLEHELMHHETLLYMVHELSPSLKRRPADLRARERGASPQRRVVQVPAGCARLGAPRDGRFRWDNELGALAVHVPAFGMDALPVTNRDYLAFADAGGYRDARLWSEDGWAWRERRGLHAPPFWSRNPAGIRVRTLFDEVDFGEAADWPAYVTHCEASAFARWAGARLPTEPEFHRAAFVMPDGEHNEHPWGDAPPGAEHGNFGFHQWGPTPVGSFPEGKSAWGIHELVGNGWEWTASAFAPFPGFEPMPRYPGYSADFFDGRHFVMLGASWATDLRLVRRSFRNWFQPHYPYVFAKFRCVRAANITHS